MLNVGESVWTPFIGAIDQYQFQVTRTSLALSKGSVYKCLFFFFLVFFSVSEASYWLGECPFLWLV